MRTCGARWGVDDKAVETSSTKQLFCPHQLTVILTCARLDIASSLHQKLGKETSSVSWTEVLSESVATTWSFVKHLILAPQNLSKTACFLGLHSETMTECQWDPQTMRVKLEPSHKETVQQIGTPCVVV